MPIRGRLSRETRKAQRDIRRFGRDASATLKRAARAGATALAGLTTAFAAASAAAVRSVNEIQRNAEFVGLTVRQFDTLQFAFSQFGVSLEDTTELLTRTGEIFLEAQRGSASWVDALRDINLTWQDLRGLSPEQQLFRIIEGIEGVTDQSRRLGLYDEIFSDVSRRAALLGREGTAGVRAFQEQLERTNGTLEASGDDFLQFTQTFQLLQRVLRNQFINALQDLAKEFGIVDGSIEGLIRQAGEFTRTVVVDLVVGMRDLVRFLVDAKEALLAIGIAFAAIKIALFTKQVIALGVALKTALAGSALLGGIGAATTAVKTFTVALLANPIFAIGAGLVAGITAVTRAFTDFGERIGVQITGFEDLNDQVERYNTNLSNLVPNFGGAGMALGFASQAAVAQQRNQRTPAQQEFDFEVTTITETLRGLEAQLNLELTNFRDDIGTAAIIVHNFGQAVEETTVQMGEGILSNIEQSRLDALGGALPTGFAAQAAADFTAAEGRGILGGIPQENLDALNQDIFAQVGASIEAAANDFTIPEGGFSEWAGNVTNQIQNALQQTFQSGGDFGDFLKSLFVGLLGNLQSAIQGAAGGGGAGGFFSGLFGGLFGGASHEGSFGRGSSNQEVLRLVTADQSILTPRQLEAIYNSGRQAAQRPEVNIFGVNYGEDFSRRLNRQGATVGNLYNQEAAEGAFS